jgi:pimeloyl-ACP methyl ester carboxylesterase
MARRALSLRLASVWLNGLDRVAPDRATRQAFSLFCSPRRRNPPEAADRPVLARAQTMPLLLDRAGVSVVAYRWPPDRGGTGSGRQRVLLAHGWESCAGRLAAWVDPLSRAGFEVFAVDAPAHGASEGRSLTALDYVEALRATAAWAGGVFAIIGHSFGGLCAALAAGDVPGPREGACSPARLVLIASPAGVAALMRRFASMLSLRPALVDRLRTHVATLSGRPVEAMEASAVLLRAASPVLVVHDTRDEEVPCADGERLAAALPHGELYVTTGLGHRPVARNPHVIRYAIDFLQRPD